mmetsp:Transcript_1637/g.3996  ORF Transcript_1637/g.3996 Transcript_1637/m.3996 type:complete len:116 (-) Transcript_1637:45-392(-)
MMAKIYVHNTWIFILSIWKSLVVTTMMRKKNQPTRMRIMKFTLMPTWIDRPISHWDWFAVWQQSPAWSVDIQENSENAKGQQGEEYSWKSIHENARDTARMLCDGGSGGIVWQHK